MKSACNFHTIAKHVKVHFASALRVFVVLCSNVRFWNPICVGDYVVLDVENRNLLKDMGNSSQWQNIEK